MITNYIIYAVSRVKLAYQKKKKKIPILIPELKCWIPIPTQVEPLGSDFDSRKKTKRVVSGSIPVLELEWSTTVR